MKTAKLMKKEYDKYNSEQAIYNRSIIFLENILKDCYKHDVVKTNLYLNQTILNILKDYGYSAVRYKNNGDIYISFSKNILKEYFHDYSPLSWEFIVEGDE